MTTNNRNQFFINEQINEVYKRDHYLCFCGKRATQIAHIIAKTKVNIKKYGKEIIHHKANLRSVCSLECNAEIMIGDCKPMLIQEQIEKIKEAMK